MKKSLLSCCLSMVLALSLAPCAAFAIDEEHQSPTDFTTRVGLENYSALSDGMLSAQSLGASRVSAHDVIAYGERYLGLPYVWGGKNPQRDGGLDCSGFVTWLFNHVCGTALDGDGVPAHKIYELCTPLQREQLRPGDLVFFYGTYGGPDFISHVGIYTGNDTMLNAGNPIGYDNIDAVRCHGMAFGRLVDLESKAIDLGGPGVSIHIANQPSGMAVPAVTVTSLGTLLREGVDYRLMRAGKSITIKGAGSCTGSRTQTFETYHVSSVSGTNSLRMAHTGAAVLDIAGGSRDEGAYAQMWSPNGTDAQGFMLERQSDGRYLIRNIKSGLALTVDADVLTIGNDTRVVQQAWRGDASQIWDIRPVEGGFALTSVLDGKLALDVQNAGTSCGARVQLWEFHGGLSQVWAFDGFTPMKDRANALAASNKDAITDGTYVLASGKSGSFALDCTGGRTENGTRMQLYERNGTAAQSFNVSHDADGYVTITSVKSGRVLDVAGAVADNGARVQLYDSNGTDAQKWIAVYDGDGMKFVSALDVNKVLDLSGGNAQNGAVIQLYDDNGSLAQRWNI